MTPHAWDRKVLVQVVFGISWFYALCASWPVERPPNALLMAPFFSKPLLLNSCLFLAAVFRASILGKAPGLYFGNFGAESAMLWASILAILGLNLGMALGLYFGIFGPQSGQGSGPQFWAILGLNLGKALGLYFDHFGAEYGHGSGPLFYRFWG